jgi:hypothetical protein
MGEITVMRRFQPDKMDVVLQPDAHTRISLHLTMNDGKIEATARCEQGDYPLLNTHWGNLQRDLEQQGVRLSALDGQSAGYGSGDSSHHPSQSNQQDSSRSLAESLIDAESEEPSALETAVIGTYKGNNLLTSWV